jgi:dipeptidyl aminopeptidase/acylaminoacyl peptidase
MCSAPVPACTASATRWPGPATHKFEGDYLDWLIGDPQQDAERYRQRTPLLHAGQIKVPVIFFQGELDAVVVPEQTRDMLAALQQRHRG